MAKSVAKITNVLLAPKGTLKKSQGVPQSTMVVCGKDYVKTHPPNLGQFSSLPMQVADGGTYFSGCFFFS